VLTTFLFETGFFPGGLPVLGVASAVVLATAIIGMLHSQRILDHPPMEILRAEE